MTTEHPDRGLESADVARRPNLLAADVRRRLGRGARLGDDVRVAFEGRLGGDLSGVMVHRGPFASHLARTLGAEALSTGEHVLGGEDTLDPSTRSGAAVLGHELSHVLQRIQGEGGEPVAQAVEGALMAGAESRASEASSGIDLDALTERIYQRIFDQLRRERDGAAWIV